MANIRIRRLVREDIEEIDNLICTREGISPGGASRRKEIMEWIAFGNPFSNGATTYYVAESNGRIIGHLGRMPMEFMINGELHKGFFPHDLYVHPEYRQKGMGFFVSMALYQALENETDSFCCNMWISPLNFRIQNRRGYYELSFDKYVKLLNPYKEIIRFVRNKFLASVFTFIVKGIFNTLEFYLTRLNSSKLQITKIERFDRRFDALNQKVSHKFDIIPSKRSDYLNWKYVDRPFSNFTRFAAEENGEVKGFLVSFLPKEEEYPTGIILDILVDPDDKVTICALCKAVIDYFRLNNVHRIECLLSDKRLAKVLKKFLFLKRFETESITLVNWKKLVEKESLVDRLNWHLTYGDSDGFMWKVCYS